MYIITRIFLYAEDLEFIYTHTHGDHAQIQNYNDDLLQAYDSLCFTHVNFVQNVIQSHEIFQ